jgi:hypothetical protein
MLSFFNFLRIFSFCDVCIASDVFGCVLQKTIRIIIVIIIIIPIIIIVIIILIIPIIIIIIRIMYQ